VEATTFEGRLSQQAGSTIVSSGRMYGPAKTNLVSSSLMRMTEIDVHSNRCRRLSGRQGEAAPGHRLAWLCRSTVQIIRSHHLSGDG